MDFNSDKWKGCVLGTKPDAGSILEQRVIELLGVAGHSQSPECGGKDRLPTFCL